MRLWSLHPSLLDSKGIVALWREGLGALTALRRRKGYYHHPQLDRFKASGAPITVLKHYLREVQREASRRGYRFDAAKLGRITRRDVAMPVTAGQVAYEAEHLQRKLEKRAPALAAATQDAVQVHPCFVVVPGAVEAWERIRGKGA